MSTKLNAKFIIEAEERLANIKSIDPNLDLGNGVSVPAFDKAIQKYHSDKLVYKTQIAASKGTMAALVDNEVQIRDLNQHLLIGIAAKYGLNSEEYAIAGGIRKVDRKQPKRKATVKRKDGQ